MKAFAGLALFVLSLSGCVAAYPSVPVERAAEILEPGDRVRVRTTNDRELEFEYVAVEDGVMIGKDQRVRMSDIKHLSRRDRQKGWQAFFLVVFFIAAASGFAID